MARMQDWQREIRDALRKENWSLRGPNSLVKVVPRDASAASELGGYITVGRSLLSKTPQQIEDALGLKRGCLAQGARIYRFTRLPLPSECEYELTALHPDGLGYSPVFSHPDYPPGSPTVHQWRIKQGFRVPVDQTNFLDLMPGQPFPYRWL